MRKDEKLSVRRQCELLGISRMQVYYEPKLPDEQEQERKEIIHVPYSNLAKAEEYEEEVRTI